MCAPHGVERRLSRTKITPGLDIEAHELARHTAGDRERSHAPVGVAIGAALASEDAPSATHHVVERSHQARVSVLGGAVLCEHGREERPDVADQVLVRGGPGGEQDGVVCVQQEPRVYCFGRVRDACLHRCVEEQDAGAAAVREA